ncbi:hypothetical protein AAU57_04770 [Nonlabens sp. YIK11]|uniref:hypothetical protein n=1 Tax=Nonlabens sp. YIK11 TaxID=1453349 RepID=UPI0006DC7DB5|nr:hypothetical protein [Nonlabens sp. YIK11]KQC32707.1 hypothetical protein AAU57_04770 [Nonlabens sp. YIK11]
MYNLVAYAIYTTVVLTIILRVGHICYINGKVYVRRLIPEDPALSDRINDILLVGYYLLNIGYGIYGISTWESVTTLVQVASTVTAHLAAITLILALIHYVNMMMINLIYKSKSKI